MASRTRQFCVITAFPDAQGLRQKPRRGEVASPCPWLSFSVRRDRVSLSMLVGLGRAAALLRAASRGFASTASWVQPQTMFAQQSEAARPTLYDAAGGSAAAELQAPDSALQSRAARMRGQGQAPITSMPAESRGSRAEAGGLIAAGDRKARNPGSESPAQSEAVPARPNAPVPRTKQRSRRQSKSRRRASLTAGASLAAGERGCPTNPGSRAHGFARTPS